MKLRLTAKLVALVTVPLLLFTAIVTAVQVVQEQSVVSAMTQALRVKSRAELTQVVSDVRTLCENANQATAQQLELDGAAFNRLLQEAGGVRIDESQRVTWDAKDQSTQATQQVGLGAMRVGKQWFGQTWDAKEPVPVVDRLRELVGGSASVMQRMNERGDMLRVATNVLGKDGRRGTGTYISHTNQDGSSNPIIDQVLAGNTFTGRVLIVDDWYLARYSPLRDERGRVFGMLMVGVRLNALADLKRSISQIKLGKTGYVWVVGAAGNERGKYIVSKGQSRDGESLWESKDAKGRRFMQDFVTHAEKLRGNEGFIEEYPWQNPHEPLRDKVAAVGYFEPWNWVIGASVYRDEAEASAADIQASMAALSKKTLALCLVSVGILIGIAVLLSRRMARPLSQLADVALLLSEGRVDVSIDHRSGDEIGTLADAFRALVLYFRTTADVARAIAAGDLQVVIAPRSEGDILSNNMAHATGVLRNLLQEITSLTKATREGDLSKRGNVDKYEGGYAALLQGMNGLLDAVAEPMQEVNRVLKCLAARNLTVRARDDFRGEYRSMVLSLNTATDNLSTSLQQVTIASGQVATASVEIAASSQSVAQGASEQASALEQTSSALIEMAASTKHNAANAERANVLAHDAKLASSLGAPDVRAMLDAMTNIRSAAEGTAAIIRDINDVAFQTNLLALNAAVEAARAGDAGRGFAVVAEEVRNLALRSKEAARKTETLIGQSVSLARQGEEISARVSGTLDRILRSVENVAGIVAEIVKTSEAQAEGIDQSTRAMSQIDQATQLAAANSQETSSAAEELAAQAQELAGLVGQFEVESTSRASEPGFKRAQAPVRASLSH